MGKISVDHEPVVFDGARPKTLGELLPLLLEELERQGRYVTSMLADGEPIHESMLNKDLDAFNAIELKSLKEDAFIGDLIDQKLENGRNFLDFLKKYALASLTLPYSEVFGKIDLFIQQITGLIDAIDTLISFGQKHELPWTNNLIEVLSTLNTELGQLVTYAQSKNLACMSDSLTQLLPTVESFIDILPHLKPKGI